MKKMAITSRALETLGTSTDQGENHHILRHHTSLRSNVHPRCEQLLKKINMYSLKVVTGRKERPSPVVNDIYLHSLYDPVKEADSFIQNNREKIFQKNYFLILGLGFAYHVNRLIWELKKRQSDKWGIVVIEPNIKVFKECVKRGLLADEQALHVFKGMEAEELYREKELIDFMMLKPVVLAHETSYNLYLDYYKSFLNYRATIKAKEIALGVDNEEIKQYLLNRGEDDIFRLKEAVAEKSILSREEMLLGAFFAVSKEVE